MNAIKLTIFFAAVLLVSCSGPAGKTTGNEHAAGDSLHIETEQLKKARMARATDTVELLSYFDLDSLFDMKNYHLEEVRRTNEVERVFVHDIRESLGEETTSIRKYDFIRIILSNSLRVNEDLLRTRHFVLDVQGRENLDEAERQHLDSLMLHYRAETKAELIDKVDIIPPSLIVCQAILESGWGRSHFAYEGNSLFGEHAPAGSPDAMKAKGANVGLRAFPSIYDAIHGYATNLNRHNAYASLREARKEMRQNNARIEGLALVNTEEHYSELGHEYVDRLREVISIYNLTDFDDCRLKDEDNLLVFIMN